MATWDVSHRDFNPRSHGGSDNDERGAVRDCWRFQPTFPRGERLHLWLPGTSPIKISTHAPTRGATTHRSYTASLLQDFNPRSHEGSDQFLLNMQEFYAISTHAPTRGATRLLQMQFWLPAISTHAPTRGATLLPSMLF